MVIYRIHSLKSISKTRIKILFTFSFMCLFSASSCVEPNKDELTLYNNLESKYNCEIDLKRGVSNASNEESKRYFQVSISECKQIENPEFVASSIALETFKTIKNSNYTHINIDVSDNEYEFKSSDIEEVIKAELYFHEVFNNIKHKKYDEVYSALWDKLKKDSNLDDFSSKLKVISSKMSFKDLTLKGFKIIRDNINGVNTQIIHLVGYFDLDKNNKCIFELFVPYEFKKKIYGLNLEQV